MKSSKRMSLPVLVSVLVLTVISLSFLYGCGSAAGGGGGGASAPGNAGISTTTTFSGVALAPSGTSVACNPGFFPMLARFFVSGAWAISGHTPVDGATVKAYNFYTGRLIETTTTDASGDYTFTSIPQGIDILIVVEKDLSGGGKLRLTAIVPNVDVQTSITGSVDATTTLAAEEMAKYFGQNLAIDPAILQTLFVSADALIAAAGGPTSLDLELGHGIITGEVGSGLFPGTLTDPMIAVTPTATQMAVAVAKAMVRDMRDCTLGLELFVSSEVERQVTAYNDVILPHLGSVESYLTGSIETIINNTMIPSLCATVNNFVTDELSLYFNSSFESFTDYFASTFEAFYQQFDHLQSTIKDVNDAMHYYTAYSSGEFNVDSTNECTKIGDTTPGTLLFHLASSKTLLVTLEGNFTAEATYDSIWERIRFISWGGSTSMDYQGVAEDRVMVGTEDAFPLGMKVNGYFIDTVISSPVTFDVSISETGSGTPPGYKSATSAITGKFLSDELSVNGSFAGIIFQDDLYPHFSNMTYNGSIDTKKLDFSGNLTMNGYNRLDEDMIPQFELSHFSSTGYISTDALSFDGSCYVDFFQDEFYGRPSYLTMQGNLRSKMVNANGSLVVNMIEDTFNGEKSAYPSHLVFNGILSSKALTFEGSVNCDMAVQAPSSTARNYPASISINGKFTPDVLGWNGNLNITTATELLSVEGYSWEEYYTKSIDFQGALTSEVFIFNGRYAATTQLYKLSNGYGRAAADYMMFDGNISTPVFFLNGSASSRYNNSFTIELIQYPIGTMEVGTFEVWYLDSLPESSSMNGILSTGLVTLEFNNLDATFVQNRMLGGAPTHLAMQSGIIRTPTIYASGNLTADYVVNNVGSRPHCLPSSASFTGTFSNKATLESTANGIFTYSCPNAATVDLTIETESNYLNVSARFQGELRAAGMPVAQADITYTRPGLNRNISTVFYGHGLNTLSGTIAMDKGSSPISMEAILTSQLGVVTHMELEFASGFQGNISDCSDISGSIKSAAGVTLGEFNMNCGLLTAPAVHYVDGSYESLF